MPCPVCDSSERKIIKIRPKRESDFKQAFLDGASAVRWMARCDECGVLYDHQLTESDDEREDVGTINCSECGSPNPETADSCSYCDARLAESLR